MSPKHDTHDQGNDAVNVAGIKPAASDEHPLINLTRQSYIRTKISASGGSAIDEHLAICVTDKIFDRALNVMDRVIKKLEAQGCKVVVKWVNRSLCTLVCIDGEEIEIRLVEMHYCRRHKPSKSELKLMEKDHFCKPPYWDEITTGQLQLQILNLYDMRGKWSEGVRQGIDQCIDLFVLGVQKAADKKKQDRKEREERERKYEEKRKRKEAEEQRIKTLLKNAAAWHESMKIRQYLDALKENMIRRDGAIEHDSYSDLYLRWAHYYADCIDPLAETVSLGNEDDH